MSDSLWPCGLQHARLPCPSPSPGACSNSSPLSQWCHPTILFSVVPFSCLQSFPASESFFNELAFASGGQSIGASASAASALPVNSRGWFPLGLTGLLSLQCEGLSRVFSSTTIRKASILCHSSLFYCPVLTSVHDYWKKHTFDYTDLCRQLCLYFLILCLVLL